LETFSSGSLNSGFILIGEVLLKLLFVKGVLHLEAVVLELVLGFNLLSDGIVLSAELVGVSDHLLDFFLGETTLIISDSNLLSLSGSFISSGDIEDTIGINIESNLDLWGTTRCGRNTFKIEFTEQVIVFGHLTLTFVDLDEDTWLIISVGCEGLLLLCWDASVSWDKDCHDSTSSLNTLRERCDIQEKKILDLLRSLTREDSSLDSGSIGYSLIRVDRSVESLSIEEVLKH